MVGILGVFNKEINSTSFKASMPLFIVYVSTFDKEKTFHYSENENILKNILTVEYKKLFF